jgi:hypothetical protein
MAEMAGPPLEHQYADADGSVEGAIDSHTETMDGTSEQPADEVTELRARLAAMFGIEGGLQSPAEEQVEPSAWDAAAEEIPAGEEIISETPAEEAVAEATVPAKSVDNFDSFSTEGGSSESEAKAEGEPTDEELMKAYLDRILGRDPNASAPAPTVKTVVDAAPMEAESSTAEGEEADAKPARRMNAEEKDALRANMDSFRELANKQARAAMVTHKSNSLRSDLQMTSVVAALICVVSVVLLTAEFWSKTSYRREGFVALAVGAGVGLYMAFSAIRIRKLQALGGSNPEGTEPGNAVEAAAVAETQERSA